MTGIFISYRRADTQGWVGRLAGALRAGFPRAGVYYDIATIRPGDDFVSSIEDALASCQAVLAIIGPRWLTVQTPEGRRRIDDPADVVRLEIERSLDRPVRLVPVLFGGATCPRPPICLSRCDRSPVGRRTKSATRVGITTATCC